MSRLKVHPPPFQSPPVVTYMSKESNYQEPLRVNLKKKGQRKYPKFDQQDALGRSKVILADKMICKPPPTDHTVSLK